ILGSLIFGFLRIARHVIVFKHVLYVVNLPTRNANPMSTAHLPASFSVDYRLKIVRRIARRVVILSGWSLEVFRIDELPVLVFVLLSVIVIVISELTSDSFDCLFA